MRPVIFSTVTLRSYLLFGGMWCFFLKLCSYSRYRLKPGAVSPRVHPCLLFVYLSGSSLVTAVHSQLDFRLRVNRENPVLALVTVSATTVLFVQLDCNLFLVTVSAKTVYFIYNSYGLRSLPQPFVISLYLQIFDLH